jgi:hypothetical protein
MYSYNPDRHGLSEVQLLKLEPWRVYPRRDALNSDFFALARPSGPRITRATPIASIGSCFAREIRNWLKTNGYRYIETATGPGADNGSARYERVYNTFTLRQEFDRAFGDFSPRERYWEFSENGAIRLLDPHRKNIAWDNKAEMEQELAEHRENVQKAFRECELLIITVGQAEIWFNKSDGTVYPLVPPVQVYDPALHGFRLTSYAENLSNLENLYQQFTANNPTGHILITVSPVPLRATFRRQNALVANCASKSILRAAVDTFAESHPDRVTYFPAYEIVTCAEENPFDEDCRHVKVEVVARIMKLFEKWFVDVHHDNQA